MKAHIFLIAFTFQLIGLISAKTESLATPAVPFQLISPAEFKVISELSNGNPFITQKRLLNSGSQVVTNIINNIVDGLISPVNITGLDSIYNSILNKPSSGTTQGYPFCAIQTNRNNRHSQRSYDGVLDPASNFGTFSINFFHPGTVKFDNYDEDVTIDESEPDYQDHQKPSVSNQNQPESSAASIATPSNYGQSESPDANKDRPDEGFAAPVISCIVVLREQSQPTTTPPPPTTTTTTTTPAPSQRPSSRPPQRPSFYPQLPGILTPQQTLGQYQVVPIPYPPFLGLVGPNWSGSQPFASNTPSSAIPPTWAFWPMANPSAISSANKNSLPAPTWPYLTIPSQQPASSVSTHHVPATSPYLSSSFWAAINPNAGITAPSPNGITIHSNPAAWLRPPAPAPAAAAFNTDQFIQQQPQQNYNEVVDEIRSAPHVGVGILSENRYNRVKTLNGDEFVIGTIERSHHQKQQSAKLKI